jgi:glycerophosphoryl diester phosphodiesterase
MRDNVFTIKWSGIGNQESVRVNLRRANVKSGKRKLLIILVFLIVIAISGIFALKKFKGHGYFSAAKNYIHYYLNRPDFNGFEPLNDDENAWYSGNFLIAHALGGIDGDTYTNSLEAFENGLGRGYKIFEADFSVTSDGKVVCSHDFENFDGVTPDYDTFMETKIYDKYTPLDMKSLVALLYENKDIYLMTDFKWDNSFGSDNHEVTLIMDELVSDIESYNDKSLYDRVIIQIYSEDNYADIEAYGCFSNYVYTLYNYAYPIYDEIAAFCLENRISVVTMEKSRATKEHVEILDRWNIKVYSHTVNDEDEMRGLMSNGVTGIYTDWLEPDGME